MNPCRTRQSAFAIRRRGVLLLEVIVVVGLLSLMFSLIVHSIITLSRSTAALDVISRRAAAWNSIDRRFRRDTLAARAASATANGGVRLTTDSGDITYEIAEGELQRIVPAHPAYRWPLAGMEVRLSSPAPNLVEALVKSRSLDRRGPQWQRQFRQCWRLMGQ